MFELRGCHKCQGDLYLEDLDWKCLQCGRYYYSPRWESYGITEEGTHKKAGKLPRTRAEFEKTRNKNKSTVRVVGV